MQITWNPTGIAHGAARSRLPASAFAFPKERKEPLTDAAHVRSAIARFSSVDGVSDTERRQAFGNIKAAATYFGTQVHAASWHDLMA
ncbi:MAG: DUF6582 domain-containing protein [Vulcanimicrobiaceae bacterium]